MWDKIAGFILLFGSIFFFKIEYRNLQVSKTGKLVSVEIFNKDCGNYKGRNSFVFIYNGKEHYDKCGSAFCRDLIIGDYIQMRVNKEGTIFLKPNENPIFQIASCAIMGCFGIFLLVFKK